MAFTPTVLLNGLVSVGEVNGLVFQENERRRSKYGALEAHVQGTPMLIPASRLTDLRTSEERVTSIDTFKKEPLGSGTARKCVGTGTGTTARTPLVYSTIMEEFSISTLEHTNNLTRQQEAFNHLLNEKLKSMASRADTLAVANLEANKSVVNAGSIYAFGTAPFDTAAHKVPNTLDKNLFFNNVSVEMQENDFDGQYWNIASTSQKALIRFANLQGAGNATNLAALDDDFSHFTSNRVTNADAAIESTSYMMTPGTVAMISWINTLERNGAVAGQDKWESFDDPFGLLGRIGLKINETCTDNSGSFAGAQADLVTSYVLSVDLAFVAAFTSDTDTGIYKYEIEG